MATSIPYTFTDMSNWTEEEYAAERIRLRQPVSEEITRRRLAALDRVAEHHRQFLERGGKPVSELEMQEAFDWSRED
jgi:hypothetical protein